MSNQTSLSSFTVYSPNEERLNTLSHALGMVLSVLAIFYLMHKAANGSISANMALDITSYLVFGLSMLALYGASTLYHAATDERKKIRFKMWDHCAIYLLIAGTYTPFLLLAIKGATGWLFLAIIWVVALLGVIFKITFKHRFKLVRVGTYVVMGWLVVFTWSDLKQAIPQEGLNWLIAGGLVYTLGVVFYLVKRIPYHHAIWHCFVLAGSSCHFLSIYWYV